jgi:hypothetical protein
MKAVFISAYQAFHQDIIHVFDKLEIRGFTYWEEVQGRGSYDGEPHYGTHAWPTLNCSFMTFVEEKQVLPLLEELRKLDKAAPLQGIRAFVMPCLEMM